MTRVRLKDICEVSWGDTSTTKASYVAEGYPAFSASGRDGYLPHFDHEGPGIVLSAIGAQCGKTWFIDGQWSCIKNTIYIKGRSADADTRFVYYATSDPGIWPKRGAAQPFISQTDAQDLEIELPTVAVQRQTVGILSAYDELVENNRRRIRILEETARALYREWFVHFRSPGKEKLPRTASTLGDIPKGWEVRTLKDVATVTYGFPFESEKFNTDGIGTPVIRIRDVPAGFSPTFTDEDVDPKYHVKDGHILVGMDGDFHMCIWSSGHALQNQRVARFESKGEIGNLHLFLALEKPIREFNKAIVGTTVAHLGDMHIKTVEIVWPPKNIRAKTREVLEPISEQIITLKRQIQNLRSTRHLLLPRLLSGQGVT
jgi:type I restriction enzyme S subunit